MFTRFKYSNSNKKIELIYPELFLNICHDFMYCFESHSVVLYEHIILYFVIKLIFNIKKCFKYTHIFQLNKSIYPLSVYMRDKNVLTEFHTSKVNFNVITSLIILFWYERTYNIVHVEQFISEFVVCMHIILHYMDSYWTIYEYRE